MTIPQKVAVFDMDGTLTDSMRWWRVSYEELLKERQAEAPAALLEIPVERRYHRPVSEILAKAYPDWAQSAEAIDQELIRIIQRHYDTDVVPMPGALELVRRLHGEGVKVVIATTTDECMAASPLRRLGFTQYIDAYYYGCDKRTTALFEEIADRYGVKPGECAMFEDALYAMRSAKAAGYAVYAMEERYAALDREEITQLADRYVRSYEELWHAEQA